ncbi:MULTISPECIES: heat-inducible transcriptional repressor HrcA [unclassified Paenibacillus]|uniref:heat-inducible transcriptional repressor HrcA n=1 Tax=unclassified Paenibacillus TaxID=185978 RepID=UPI0009567F3B|nr:MULTISPECIES: heat-inducible transcriptional repressor HrcA [unclassified Paenibacillus]ASS66032.1 heat-inducible transcriptional repressor HrcA [Paenibacillus sp. RUD330]SIQ14784.1 heat-inducible transcription repressor HrcA [Paenibacillus sp. RU4X]SIQ36617.1 heat-inducible transcription repressor HrcA [Paenibacillus sp. RU4T]
MLTERQQLILGAIINDYIRSAEPVGSRSISKRGDVGFSPATIRNEMADLEELGFLEQPHTSAGRIPSIQGYRYYVDHLMKHDSVTDSELKTMRSFFASRMIEMEQVVQHAAMIISNLTNYTSIVLGPDSVNQALKHFQLVPLGGDKAVAIVVTDTGHVENRTVTIPADLDMSDMEKAVRFLNERLSGVPLLRLKSRLFSEAGEEMGRYAEQIEGLLGILEQALRPEQDGRLFVSGTTNILTQPEFKDVDKVKTLFDLLDETPTMLKLFSSMPEGIQVRIGTENDHEAIASCSLITATYALDGHSLGTIGILGPTRMDYGKVISLLGVLSSNMHLMIGRGGPR